MGKLYKFPPMIRYVFLPFLIVLGLNNNLNAQCLSGGSSVETGTIMNGSQCIYTLEVTFVASANLRNVTFGSSLGTIQVDAFTLVQGTNTVTAHIMANCAAPLPDIIVNGIDLSFNACGTLTIPFDSALPVELTGFRAETKNGSTRLIWTTASEYNTNEFILERSINGSTNFQVIGHKPAVGFTEVPQQYELIDPFPPALAYYRLRVVDFDGTFAFSDIVVASQKGWEIKQLHLGPNPISKELLSISFEKNGAAPANAILVNSQGQIVWNKDQILGEGLLSINADLSEQPNGIYYLMIRQGRQVVASEKVIKLDTY